VKLCFIDTETTSLDPRTGQIWEVGLIVRETDPSPASDEGEWMETQYVWQLPVCLEFADPMSLKIGGFHDRRWRNPKIDSDGFPAHPVTLQALKETLNGSFSHNSDFQTVLPTESLVDWADHFVELTRGSHLVGNSTSFDEERLRKLLNGLHQCPMWHYQLVEVKNLVAGALHLPPTWSSEELSETVGAPVPQNRHSALADARWAADMYDAVMEMQIEGYAADLRRGLMNERAEKAGTKT